MVYRIHKFKGSVTEKLIFDCNELMKGILQSDVFSLQMEFNLKYTYELHALSITKL